MDSSSSNTPIDNDVFIIYSDRLSGDFAGGLSRKLRCLEISVIEENEKTLLPESRLYLPDETRLAIHRSRICVVVFSTDLVFSKRFLSTLAEIIEWRDRTADALMIPVFYEIDRSEVEQQRGIFKKAFYEFEIFENEDRVSEWRNALKDAARDKEVFEFKRDHRINSYTKGDLHNDIVASVYERLHPTKNIGIYSRVLEISDLVYNQHQGISSIGIWGMAGIGKTTIAKTIFNQKEDYYANTIFISDFDREFREKGMQLLREECLPQYVMDKLNTKLSPTTNTRPFYQGKHYPLLFVLDDVRNATQAESFLGGFKWFEWGSMIIITSRDKHVLAQCQVNDIYEAKSLDDGEGFKLFTRLAEAEESHTKVSRMVIKYADGNAKALRCYGRELKGKTPEEMETAFNQLKLCPPSEILELVKNSFDELSDNEKNIFLDIACFFRGETLERVVAVLEGCGFYAHVEIDNLVDKSLVTIHRNRLEMSDLIRDLAREILKQQVWIGSSRRLCDQESIQPLLEDEVTKPNGEGICLENIERILLEASNLSFVVDPEAFRSLYNLRLLKIYSLHSEKRPGLDLSKGLASLPKELRLLHWEHYSLKSLPDDFEPDNLVELNMPYSQLQILWEQSKNFKSLKTIILPHSEKLVEIKEISGAHNLQHIDLKGCSSLQSFPATWHLKHVKILNLSGCAGIKVFPEVPPNIKELYLNGTNISQIPESIENLSKLVKLNLGNCLKLEDFIVKIYKMESLEMLNLSGCKELKSFPEIPDETGQLRFLYLSDTAIEELHTSFSNLTGLKVLRLSRNVKGPFSLRRLKSLEGYI